MSADMIEILVGAVPATLAILIYSVGAKWYKSLPGWAFFSAMLSVALLLDLTLVLAFAPIPPAVALTIARVVVGIVIVSSFLKLTAVLREQYLRRRRRRRSR